MHVLLTTLCHSASRAILKSSVREMNVNLRLATIQSYYRSQINLFARPLFFPSLQAKDCATHYVCEKDSFFSYRACIEFESDGTRQREREKRERAATVEYQQMVF